MGKSGGETAGPNASQPAQHSVGDSHRGKRGIGSRKRITQQPAGVYANSQTASLGNLHASASRSHSKHIANRKAHGSLKMKPSKVQLPQTAEDDEGFAECLEATNGRKSVTGDDTTRVKTEYQQRQGMGSNSRTGRPESKGPGQSQSLPRSSKVNAKHRKLHKVGGTHGGQSSSLHVGASRPGELSEAQYFKGSIKGKPQEIVLKTNGANAREFHQMLKQSTFSDQMQPEFIVSGIASANASYGTGQAESHNKVPPILGTEKQPRSVGNVEGPQKTNITNQNEQIDKLLSGHLGGLLCTLSCLYLQKQRQSDTLRRDEGKEMAKKCTQKDLQSYAEILDSAIDQSNLRIHQGKTGGANSGYVQDTRLSNSGRFVIAAQNQPHQSSAQLEMVRQNHLLQQQVRQQQNQKSHVQSVHLEVKGNQTASPNRDKIPFQVKTVETVPQPQSVDSHAAALNGVVMHCSPRSTLDQRGKIASAFFAQKQSQSPKSVHPGGVAQHHHAYTEVKRSSMESQLPHALLGNPPGLQNSKSPFQMRSHKAPILEASAALHGPRQNLIASSAACYSQTGVATGVGDKAAEPHSLIASSKKRGSSKGYSRKHSAALNPARQGQVQAVAQRNSIGFAHSGHAAAEGPPVPSGNSIKVVPMTIFGQNGLQQQAQSRAHIRAKANDQKDKQVPVIIESSGPKAGDTKLRSSLLNQLQVEAALGRNGPANILATGNSLANDSAAAREQMQTSLLNMSKQRAYTMEGTEGSNEKSLLPETPIGERKSIATSSKMPHIISGPREVKPSSLASHGHTKHSRTVKQTASKGSQLLSSSRPESTQKLTSKKSSDGIPFQKSGKQIVQGQSYNQIILTSGQSSAGKAVTGMTTSKLTGQQTREQSSRLGTANAHDPSKTSCPLSIFEMQFYKGDFQLSGGGKNKAVIQNQMIFIADGANGHPASVPVTAYQQHQSVSVGKNSIPQGSNFASHYDHVMMKQANTREGGSQSPNQASEKAPKVNFVALQNAHQHWLNSSPQMMGKGSQQRNKMPVRNTGGSQSHLNIGSHLVQQQSQQHTSGSPIKPYQGSGSKGIANQAVPSQTVTIPIAASQTPQCLAPGQQPAIVNGPNGAETAIGVNLFGHGPQGRQLLQQTLGPVMSQQEQVLYASKFPQGLPSAFTHQGRQQDLSNALGNLDISDFAHQKALIAGSNDLSTQLYALQLQQHYSNVLPEKQRNRREHSNQSAHNMFKRVASKIPFENAYVEDCYKFIIGYGNNSNLIRNALKQRSWWIEIQPVHSMFNLKWNPVSDGIKFGRLGHIDPHKRDQLPTNAAKVKKGSKEGSHGGVPAVQDKVNFQMVNHLECHQLLTEKYNLLMVMQRFCDQHKENTFDLMPITFFVEIPDASRDQLIAQALTPFVTFYQALEVNKNRLDQLKEQLIRQLHQKQELEEREATENAQGQNAKPNQAFLDKIQRLESVTGGSLSQPVNAGKITKFKTFNFEKRTFQKYTMPLCHFDSFNLWLLKPTHLNRGRGIHVFRDLDTLNRLIKQYCIGKEEISKRKDPKESPDKTNQDPNVEDEFESEQEAQDASAITQPVMKSPMKGKSMSSSSSKIKHNTFIIQKYIERPLLIFRRKFDIRVWVLLSQDHDLFFFKEGYLRTSSTEFSIDLQNIDNAFVHLTNNAVQKHAENYGDFEDGNQLSFPRFQKIIDEFFPEKQFSVYEQLVPQMQEVIVKTFNAVRRTVDPNRRKYCFELFGYDFILDEDFNSWLIEVNTNPCLEESSQLLKALLPRMIEDMLKLTVDVVFPKNFIRRKNTFKKKFNVSPQKQGAHKGAQQDLSSSPQKRVSTANKQQHSSADDPKEKPGQGGAGTDTEPTPSKKLHSQTNSTDANLSTIENIGNRKVSSGLVNNDSSAGDFTSQAGISHSIPDSEYKDKDTGASEEPRAATSAQNNAVNSPLMTIKEKFARGRIHPVQGYSDSENMWTKLANIEKDALPNVTRFPNCASQYIVQVHDKIFKLRKNPAYTGPLSLPELKPDPAEVEKERKEEPDEHPEESQEKSCATRQDEET